MRDHFGFDASDYDAPSKDEQDEFFAVRDEYELGHHTHLPNDNVWAVATRALEDERKARQAA